MTLILLGILAVLIGQVVTEVLLVAFGVIKYDKRPKIGSKRGNKTRENKRR